VNTFQPADNITRVQPPKNWIVSIAKHTVRNIKNQRILARLNGIFGPPPANPNNLQANNTIVLPFQNRVEGELQGYDEPKQAPRTDTPISASIPNEAIKASSSAVPGPSSTSHRNVGSDHNQLYPDAHQEGYGNLPPELFDAWNGPVTDDTFLEHNQMHGQKPSKKLIRFDPAIGQRYLENIPGPTVTLRNLFEEANPSPTTMYQEWESDRHWLLRKLDREPRQPAMLQH
jgi:hypothetical protein